MKKHNKIRSTSNKLFNSEAETTIKLAYLPHKIWGAVLAIILAMTAFVIVQILTSAIFSSPSPFGVYTSIVQYIMIIIVIIVVNSISLRRFNLKDLGFEVPHFMSTIIYSFGFALVFNLLVALAEYLIPSLASSSTEVMQSFGLGKTLANDIVLGLTVCSFAPLWEELCFRGLLFRSVRDSLSSSQIFTAPLFKKTPIFKKAPLFKSKSSKSPMIQPSKLASSIGTIVALLISSYLFMSIHGGDEQNAQLVFLFVLAILLALSYILTGSLLAPILLHSLNNTYALITGINQAGIKLSGGLSPYIFLLGPVIATAIFYIFERIHHKKSVV